MNHPTGPPQENRMLLGPEDLYLGGGFTWICSGAPRGKEEEETEDGDGVGVRAGRLDRVAPVVRRAEAARLHD